MMTPSAMRQRGVAALARAIVQRAVEAAVGAVRDELAQHRARGERSIHRAAVLAVETDGDGITWLDLECRPSGMRLTAQLCTPLRSLVDRPRVGDEVLAAMPGGDLHGCPYVIGIIHTDTRPEPAFAGSEYIHATTDKEIHLEAAQRLRLESSGGNLEAEVGAAIDLRAATGATLATSGGELVLQAPSVEVNAPVIKLGTGGKAVARTTDAVSIPISGAVLTWLNAVGSASGAGAFPGASLSGTITGGNANVTA
jgi:hypothetical protein